jgi:hypothetical protein
MKRRTVLMLKKTVCCASILLSLSWLAAKGFNVSARTGNGIPGDSRFPTDAQQSQSAVISAERDQGLAEIKKRIAGREDEPAEKVFKNIEILKGKKASRLPGMMSALTGLLGVNCTHCHVKDKWDSEEKPTKQTARKMFRMIGAINDDYFEGQNKVSCWTCHRGSPNPPIQ